MGAQRHFIGPGLHLLKVQNEAFVASKEVSALVPSFKGRDLVMDRLAVMGIAVPTAGVGGHLLLLKMLPSILQLVCPEEVDTIEDLNGLMN